MREIKTEVTDNDEAKYFCLSKHIGKKSVTRQMGKVLLKQHSEDYQLLSMCDVQK